MNISISLIKILTCMLSMIVISIILLSYGELLLLQGSFFYAEQLWQIVIEKIVKVWENKDRNKEIHKGSAYYFWAITCILKEDFEKGFLLMHKALEDKLYSSNIRLHQLMHVLLLTMNKMNNTFVPKY